MSQWMALAPAARSAVSLALAPAARSTVSLALTPAAAGERLAASRQKCGQSAVSRNTSLNATRRARELAELAETSVDVLVVGLGVTGAGVALDAASRGLSVAAVDAHDLAFGTSRWSSKLVHGGLRYLAHGQIGVAHESAVERGILMTRTAPHLIRALPSLMPGHNPKVRLGFAAGDLLRMAARTPRSVLPKPRKLSTVETRAIAPYLREDIRGGLISWDGQLSDDVRLVVALARAAAGFGARIITRCRAVTAQTLRDELTGEQFDIRAKVVVNATGVWASHLAPSLKLRPSRGTHLVLPHIEGLCTGLTIPVSGSRYVFALPQLNGRVYVGLTDEPVDGPLPDVPTAPESDIVFLLDVLNSVLRTPIKREQILGSYAGLRPLLDAPGPSGDTGRSGPSAGSRTADMSRRHAVHVADGVVTIVGGKLTTYRRMAEDAVDATNLTTRPCVTRNLPLPGADHIGGSRLERRYGSEAAQVAALGTEEVAPGVTTGELHWGVLHEGALDVDDLLDRRTRAGLVPADRAAALPAAQAALTATPS